MIQSNAELAKKIDRLETDVAAAGVAEVDRLSAQQQVDGAGSAVKPRRVRRTHELWV